MSVRWQNILHRALIGLRDLALTLLITGGAQVVIGFVLWPLLFRGQKLGLSLALSLVGFGSWALAFLLSISVRRGRLVGEIPLEPPGPFEDHPVLGGVQDQIQRAGGGFTLLMSSLVPLGIALVLRVQSDLRSGLTLREIFPPMP